jgi:hypothetical protein
MNYAIKLSDFTVDNVMNGTLTTEINPPSGATKTRTRSALVIVNRMRADHHRLYLGLGTAEEKIGQALIGRTTYIFQPTPGQLTS